MVNLTDCMMHNWKVDGQACGQGIHFLCGTQTFVIFKESTVWLETSQIHSTNTMFLHDSSSILHFIIQSQIS